LLAGASEESPVGSAIAEWARARGWALTIGAGEGEIPGLRAAVAVTQDEAPTGSIAASANIEVIVVDPAGITPSENVSTIGGSLRRDQAGFLAGVLAGLASQTGWVGRIDGTGGEQEAIYRSSFVHGLRYGCARCQLISAAVGEANVDFFRANGTDVVWAVPGPAADAALAALAEGGWWVVWSEHPPSGVAEERLVGGVGLRPEAVLGAALDWMMAGESGRDWPYDLSVGSMGLADLNSAALSPGRQRIAAAAVQALASGALDTGIDPLTGEER
jgi:hypothetical protein